MSIFTLYPKVDYAVDEYDKFRAIDITNSSRIKEYLKEFRGIAYNPYVVQNGERPDQVSYAVYKTPDYDWIIMIVNDMYSVYDDWPKSDESLKKYIVEKYGSVEAAQQTIKYYNVYGNEIDFTFWQTLPADDRGLSTETAYEYEMRKNTNKSKIKVVRQEIISSIENNFKFNTIKPIR